ncbi:transcriptional regulator BetI [Oceaniovalibus sp. ACAM 378]|uniref:choline-binding transcriptional repressor BetI n=1 Tax=Oceaniovalibus sp. ACAM 378 TaxID=2599923 RepID=UPI0011D9061E|nr:transcriptional regulator BetI [Oceaniovalibus sp. ACAM 378]TYB84441.1 transcriptional regulator BetI [Oceaniovalibus sp. ACAM 378]
MPKLGMEPIRRDALVKATISEIGRTGSLGVTVAQIARRAGMSTALAHHYFGGKDRIFLAAMRHILTLYSASVRGALVGSVDPRERLERIVRASFEPGNFRAEVIGAWLTFYVQAQTVPDAERLLHVYQRRLRSNLMHELRALTDDPAPLADLIGALIDGLYIRAALGQGATGKDAADTVLDVLDRMLGPK